MKQEQYDNIDNQLKWNAKQIAAAQKGKPSARIFKGLKLSVCINQRQRLQHAEHSQCHNHGIQFQITAEIAVQKPHSQTHQKRDAYTEKRAAYIVHPYGNYGGQGHQGTYRQVKISAHNHQCHAAGHNSNQRHLSKNQQNISGRKERPVPKGEKQQYKEKRRQQSLFF